MSNAKPFSTEDVEPLDLPTPIKISESGGELETNSIQWSLLRNQKIARNITSAHMYAFQPAADEANRKNRAIIVAPGGAFEFLSIEREGARVAKALAEAGYTAFLLAYRTKPTEIDTFAFGEGMNRKFQNPEAPDDPNAPEREFYPPASSDAESAMLWVRMNAARYGIDESNVGFLGFSAGAHVGQALVQQSRDRCVPESLAIIYGGLGSIEPLGRFPALFVAQAFDDTFFAPAPICVADAWLHNKKSVELHLYETGGHGRGLAQDEEVTFAGWLSSYLAWMSIH